MKFLCAHVMPGLMLLLSGCSGGATVDSVSPGASVSSPVVDVPEVSAFETYVTDDTGYNRTRASLSRSSDIAILNQFEDENPASPAGYKSLIALDDKLYSGDARIEVIAQVPIGSDTEAAIRLLRLTVDQAPMEIVPGTKGRYFLRGDNFSWVTIDGGPLLSGSDNRGLVNLVLDFDKGSANINLRTGDSGQSVVRSEIEGDNLPFDIRDGSFGGVITVQVWNPDNSEIYSIGGHLRGNVGGSTAYANDLHGLSASGLYAASGQDNGASVQIDGAFAGIDPNRLP